MVKVCGLASRSVHASTVTAGISAQGTAIAGGTIVCPMAWAFAGMVYLA